MAQRSVHFQPRRQHLILVAFIAIAIYVLLPQLGDFQSSWRLLQHPQPGWLVMAISFTVASYLAATATYCLLAFKKLRYDRSLLVQLGAMFVNRLLPAGTGAIGANYLYLRHERHKASQAGTVVALNNILGFTGHFLLLAVTLAVSHGERLKLSSGHSSIYSSVLKASMIIGISLLLLGLVFGRKRLARSLNDLKQQLFSYRHRLKSLAAALFSSATLTTCNVLALAFCLAALGLHLPFANVLLVFTFGVGAGAAVPTPGGLGGFEAGLAAGFIAYGIPPASALAAALLYRLVSYWLPLGVGAVAFVVCQRGKLFEPAFSVSKQKN